MFSLFLIKHLCRHLFIVFCLGISCAGFCNPRMFQKAAEQNLPIVALFLGDESCPWSQKIRQELLVSSFFQEKVGEEALIWQSSGSQDLQKYSVDQLPCVMLLDPRGREFARLDYGSSHPVVFSKKILSLIQDFHCICLAVDQGLSKQNEAELKALYLRASHLSVPCFKQVILSQGLKKEKGTFFRLEKYQILLEKCRLKQAEVVKLRKEVLSRDPDNRWGTWRQLALCEFKKKASLLKREGNLDKVLAPLVHYLDKFGSQDEENRWKLEMTMAEFLFSKQALKQALVYAKTASEHAPDEAKSQILKTLSQMQRRFINE